MSKRCLDPALHINICVFHEACYEEVDGDGRYDAQSAATGTTHALCPFHAAQFASAVPDTPAPGHIRRGTEASTTSVLALSLSLSWHPHLLFTSASLSFTLALPAPAIMTPVAYNTHSGITVIPKVRYRSVGGTDSSLE